ncbi:MAG: GNAT family N-acetyltransferase [Halanaerobiales bacterium]
MIRKADERDIEVIAEYNCMMALETENLKLNKKTVISGVKHAVNDPEKASYYLYEVDGEVVGQLMITKEWSDWRDGYFLWIQSVYVLEEYRRQGIFKALYNHIEDIVNENSDLCGIRLYVERNNKRARQTYAIMGMEETHYLLYEMEK